MNAEVYADVLFAINFLMNGFILCMAGKMSGRKVKILRCSSASAVVSALYCIIFFKLYFLLNNNITSLIIMAAFIFMAVFIAFRPKTRREFLHISFLTAVSAIITGGVTMALFFVLFAQEGVLKNGTFPAAVLIVSTLGSYIFFKFIHSNLQKKRLQKQCIYTVKIYYNGAETELRGLVDTGNTLTDPISKMPVIIAELSSLKKCLPTNVLKLYDENKNDNLADLLDCISGTPFSLRMRMIPFHSVGTKNGVLIGFKPDKIEIHTEKEVSAVIGIYTEKLTADGEYNALLNPALIQ